MHRNLFVLLVSSTQQNTAKKNESFFTGCIKHVLFSSFFVLSLSPFFTSFYSRSNISDWRFTSSGAHGTIFTSVATQHAAEIERKRNSFSYNYNKYKTDKRLYMKYKHKHKATVSMDEPVSII